MEEILPGIHYWTTFHDGIGTRVHSYYVEPAAALIDPMVPEEGLEAFAGMVEPRQVLMTNRHHFRHSDRFRAAFGCVVRASAPGMGDLEGRGVEPFRFGDEVAPGITAFEIGVLCPDETALHIADGGGAVAFADGLVRRGRALGFVSDPLLGDDPPAIKRGLKEAFRGLLPLDFDALLFAHGEPQASGGRAALRTFVGESTE
ncbi:MAG: hypothetical protein QOJ25_474 [Solirubrobacteraceae bacterium]|nr:hypothetical protein [Solirubrobacteraceae bacterium]